MRNVQGVTATITNYGGTLTGLFVPDRDGKLGNVVLGFDSLAAYIRATNPYFGGTIGRYGNRLAKGQFTLDGKTYQVPINNPPNALHGGKQGFNRRVWSATPSTAPEGPSLTLNYVSQDGEEGYPGTLRVQIVYTLTNTNTLRLRYTATTDQPTVLNLTNHSYFNLGYGQSQDILGHVLTLAADRFTPVDKTLIPTGELQSVAGTPMDFRQPHTIGERIGQVPGGYDHNWVLADKLQAVPELAASVYEPRSGRIMEVYTDQPGVQFYSGNFLKGNLKGIGGVTYGQHYGFALETQHFPDSPNQPNFPSTVLRPGQAFHSTTEYHFGVRK
ncbi:aldose epimerase family protein [Hymenobacter sp. GOD-10R]|uniref:aldose epimerase family protein n=1 Tax=Hymenobacter sp. GOD-10R TaxID=3093922 RepID=UPI002D785D4E|nr:aldose epimerase family protein [Hymenobacter sp. GOD-10R]WRQ27980.1 aldose epimerase family protein [Hymenobacter sp. GOD-10R]